ncbi:MAG: hypothetical protein RIQ81_254 [Pseudomonadota bacterium]
MFQLMSTIVRKSRTIRDGVLAATLFFAPYSAVSGAPLVQGILPARVDASPANGAASRDNAAEAWDINGDGYPDMVRIQRSRPDVTGASAEVAFDFDADGKPDFFRTEGSQRADAASR